MAPGASSWTGQAATFVQEGGQQRKHPAETAATQPTSVAEVSRLESAIFGVRSHCWRLKAGENSSNCSPDPRQDQCVQGVPRACKEATRADAVIARALEQKSIFDGEVADGEKWLQDLQLEEAHGPVFVPLPIVAELQQ